MYANVLNSYGHLDWREVDEPGMSSDDVMIKVGVARHLWHGSAHLPRPLSSAHAIAIDPWP